MVCARFWKSSSRRDSATRYGNNSLAVTLNWCDFCNILRCLNTVSWQYTSIQTISDLMWYFLAFLVNLKFYKWPYCQLLYISVLYFSQWVFHISVSIYLLTSLKQAYALIFIILCPLNVPETGILWNAKIYCDILYFTVIIFFSHIHPTTLVRSIDKDCTPSYSISDWFQVQKMAILWNTALYSIIL